MLPSAEHPDDSATSRDHQHRIWTVGHSTRSLESFIELLRAHNIQTLVDVRHYPRSRRHPHFNADTLSEDLAEVDIRYHHIQALGGRRRTMRDSPNTGWRSDQFRGYADYMLTPQFVDALEELMRIAAADRTAIMCAEAVPWRCHRSLIADALIVRGWEVLDITGTAAAKPHSLTPFAVPHGDHLLYPSESPESPAFPESPESEHTERQSDQAALFDQHGEPDSGARSSHQRKSG